MPLSFLLFRNKNLSVLFAFETKGVRAVFHIRIETPISPAQISFLYYRLGENCDYCEFSYTVDVVFSNYADNILEQNVAAALQYDKSALVFRSSPNFVPE